MVGKIPEQFFLSISSRVTLTPRPKNILSVPRLIFKGHDKVQSRSGVESGCQAAVSDEPHGFMDLPHRAAVPLE